jgi:hypothetical protein
MRLSPREHLDLLWSLHRDSEAERAERIRRRRAQVLKLVLAAEKPEPAPVVVVERRGLWSRFFRR